MRTTLENEKLTVSVDTFGAELQSIMKDQVEYLWQGDEAFWGRRAPILFPIVGKLKNGQYKIEEQPYQLSQHGFARDNEFQMVIQTKDEVIYELISTDETMINYPFEFLLRVSYKLKGSQIHVRYQVQNKGENFMYFGIGAHPAFNVPLENGSFEDYKLTVSPDESRQFIPFNSENGTVQIDKSENRQLRELPLTHELFAQDALIYKSSKKMEVTLSNDKDSRSVKVSWENMPYFGLWSPYPKEAPFVCIEPWCGLTDDANTDGDISTKFAINELAPEEKFNCEYVIEIN
ncbi:MAG: aldose 1-epimerase family protein [Streptococcaceae bacterium]|nr:aldose 1-epimerase family protein [Streptococcaceae bacterium]MCL2681164.1 aldose 1-epimerase family protein [Streptococcaceae bacterium]MCL2858479.1 aldose 1-epimerase family protein [Streptococcaceae bacterium]